MARNANKRESVLRLCIRNNFVGVLGGLPATQGPLPDNYCMKRLATLRAGIGQVGWGGTILNSESYCYMHMWPRTGDPGQAIQVR